MLFILTGKVQTGKTRWLQAMVDELVHAGIPVAGVLAPGVWTVSRGEESGTTCGKASPSPANYEKLGIENILLPSGERIEFARRRDLAEQARAEEGSAAAQDRCAQSTQAGLSWQIPDSAIARVNEHFAELMRAAENPSPQRGGLLVADELGKLELLHGKGLTEAVHALERGASPAYPHALAVVRDYLVDCALDAFRPHWDEVRVIEPGEAARSEILGCFADAGESVPDSAGDGAAG
jgi:hypothetical protein